LIVGFRGIDDTALEQLHGPWDWRWTTPTYGCCATISPTNVGILR
jgi:hypothetical protein